MSIVCLAEGGSIMENEKKGVIQISDEVISVIAATAALEIDGVVKLVAPTNLMDKFSKKNSGKTKGVELSIADGTVTVNVSIMAKYDCKIREVAQKVQENIKNTIETMTGLKAGTVNVIVSDIEYKDTSGKAE